MNNDTPSVRLFDRQPALPDMTSEILTGLRAEQKYIPPKYFYDERGSRLFDEITELPEYYPTRTEIGILKQNQGEFGKVVDGLDANLVEYGSGSSVKVRILLDARQPTAYVPVDISREHLVRAAESIAADYPGLLVCPTCADYTKPFELPEPVTHMQQVGFFPGSSIGNFSPDEADAFLAGVALVIGPGGWFMIGADTKKDPAVLHDAYNDDSGVTAAFNKNLLMNVNAALDADFDPDAFEHKAIYNERHGRVEMYLVAQSDQLVQVAGEEVRIEAGEELHTENSHKYETDEFARKLDAAGFDCVDVWRDERDYFMVLLCRVR